MSQQDRVAEIQAAEVALRWDESVRVLLACARAAGVPQCARQLAAWAARSGMFGQYRPEEITRPVAGHEVVASCAVMRQIGGDCDEMAVHVLHLAAFDRRLGELALRWSPWPEVRHVAPVVDGDVFEMVPSLRRRAWTRASYRETVVAGKPSSAC